MSIQHERSIALSIIFLWERVSIIMNKNLSYGPIFKYHRRKAGLGLETIAKDTKINISRISKFENKRVFLNNEDINVLFKSIGLEFSDDKSHEYEFIQHCNSFFDAIFFEADFKNEWVKIENMRKKIETSSLFPLYLLVQYVYLYYSKNHDQFKEKQEIMLSFLDCFSFEQIQIYNDVTGLYYKSMNDYEKCVDIIESSVHLTDSTHISGMMYYHLAMVYKNMGKLSLALEKAEKALKIFSSYINVKRIIGANMLIALIKSSLGNYDEAEIIHNRCVYISKMFPVHNYLSNSYNNLILNYVLAGKYSTAIQYYLDNESEIENQGSIFVFLAFCYIKMNDNEKAKVYIRKAKQFSTNESNYTKVLISTIYNLISDKKSEEIKDKRIERLYQYSVKSKCIADKYLSLDVILDYYERKNDLNRINFYQKEKIKLLENRTQD